MKSKIMALMSISYLIVFAIIIMVSILSYFDFVDENITSMKADNEILAITNPK